MPAIRFICLDDASSDPNSDGYWMQLSQWNRFRHDTFKERPDDESSGTEGSEGTEEEDGEEDGEEGDEKG